MSRPPEGPPAGLAKIPCLTLRGDAERRYVRTTLRALRRARLNLHYPDARRLGSHLGALGPEVHRGLYPGLQIDSRSGLPTYREWTRVQTDRLLAAELLARLGDERSLQAKARAAPDSIHARQLRKHGYYTALGAVRLAPLGDMDVALRRVDSSRQTAWFHVILDKLAASGHFVRVTLDLRQRAGVFARPMVTLDDDTAQHTERLRSLIYRFGSLDAELVLMELMALDDIEVERVVRGVIGPLWFAGVGAPAPLQPLLARHPEGVVASFALDMAANDVASDRNNDPFMASLAGRLSADAQQGYERARGSYGYHVFRDRKFVCSPELVGPLRALCVAAGTNNIIYRL